MSTHCTTPTVNSRYQKHRKDWLKCEACPLCKTRSQVVLYRGTLPCDVLFVGEAPGDSEDAVGEPFVPLAPAGELLEYIIAEAFTKANIYRDMVPRVFNLDRTNGSIAALTVGITNIVACRPKSLPDEYSSGKIRPPEKDEIEACQERLHEIIRMAAPRLIVTLGDIARKHLPSGYPPPRHLKAATDDWSHDPAPDAVVTNLIHPSAILRMDDKQKPLAEKRAILALAKALEALK
jgi:DNA polymerase